jgi:hypothetical protein
MSYDFVGLPTYVARVEIFFVFIYLFGWVCSFTGIPNSVSSPGPVSHAPQVLLAGNVPFGFSSSSMPSFFLVG